MFYDLHVRYVIQMFMKYLSIFCGNMPFGYVSLVFMFMRDGGETLKKLVN